MIATRLFLLRSISVFIVIIAAVIPGSLLAQEPPVLFDPPLSPRIANYEIWVDYDPDRRLLTAKEILTWFNKTEEPVSELHFHLYLNSFRNNRSTFAVESRSNKEKDWGFSEISRIELTSDLEHVAVSNSSEPVAEFPLNTEWEGERRLETSAEFIQPDDGNADDRTVLKLPLPLELEPGQGIQLEIPAECNDDQEPLVTLEI